MAIKVSLIDGMGTATTDGSTVTLDGATSSDFMHIANDVLFGEGVNDNTGTSCQVVENSPAGMSVLVKAGVAYVLNSAYVLGASTQKYFRVENSADFEIAIAANGAGSTRIDLICAKVDVVTTPDNTASNVGTLVRVAGTAGAGVPATPALHTVLAQVSVAPSETAINTADITDVREQMFVKTANLADGEMQNGQISRTVASNNMTVSILTKAGNTPSVASPVFVGIAGKTRAITSALSITLNAGTNQFGSGSSETAALEVDYPTYLGWRTASETVFLAFARLPYFVTYADASATVTNNKYLAYTGSAPAGTDALHVVGRFNATKSATAGFNWSVPATSVIINKPVYETRWLTWAPTITGYSAVPTSTRYNYRIVGNMLEIMTRENATGTSNSTATAATLPISCTTLSNYILLNVASGTDNGAAVASRIIYDSTAPTTLTSNPALTGGAWTASGAKRGLATATLAIRIDG